MVTRRCCRGFGEGDGVGVSGIPSARSDNEIIAPSHVYPIRHDRIDRIEFDQHMKTKPWLDYESFVSATVAAAALFSYTDQQQDYEDRRRRK